MATEEEEDAAKEKEVAWRLASRDQLIFTQEGGQRIQYGCMEIENELF